MIWLPSTFIVKISFSHSVIQDDVNGLAAPNLKQDPLLKQLRRRPENFKDDFLQLPRRKQDTLLKVLRSHGMPPFDIDKLKPPTYKQNPLLRLLRPSKQVNLTFWKLIQMQAEGYRWARTLTAKPETRPTASPAEGITPELPRWLFAAPSSETGCFTEGAHVQLCFNFQF